MLKMAHVQFNSLIRRPLTVQLHVPYRTDRGWRWRTPEEPIPHAWGQSACSPGTLWLVARGRYRLEWGRLREMIYWRPSDPCHQLVTLLPVLNLRRRLPWLNDVVLWPSPHRGRCLRVHLANEVKNWVRGVRVLPQGCQLFRFSRKLPDFLTKLPSSVHLSLIHIWRCRRSYACRSRWSPYH